MFTRLVLPALALALAAPAAAETAAVKVSYADLDLTKADGRAALDRRLERAAQRLCGTRPVRNLAMMQSHKACMAEARASYVPQVEIALNAANARRVAVLADKIGLLASF